MRAGVALAFCLLAAVPDVAASGACWLPPVEAAVADPFRPPACPWCPGNRGLEYATESGQAVRSVSAGTVAFSGLVAGVAYVTVEVNDSRLVTYGRLAMRLVDAGQRVRAGQVVGRTGAARFILTVRRDGDYVDPAPLLGRLVRRAYLVPVDGTHPREPPAPRLECPGTG